MQGRRRRREYERVKFYLPFWYELVQVEEQNGVVPNYMCGCMPKDPQKMLYNPDEYNKLCMRGQLQYKLLSFRNRVLSTLLVLMWVMFIPMLVKTFRLFHCVEVADLWFLEADMQLQCYDIFWTIAVGSAGLVLMCWGCCLPCTQFELARRQKYANVEHYLSVMFDPAPVERRPPKPKPDLYVFCCC